MFKILSGFINKGVKRKADREREVAGAPSQGEMSLVSHVVELRKHIVKSLLWLLFWSIVTMSFMDYILEFLRSPYEKYMRAQGKSAQLISIGLYEVIMMNFKVCLIVAGIISAPFIIRELWRFVSPALYPQEKKIILPVVVASIFLFFAGISFGFFIIVPSFLGNTIEWASQYATVMLTVENYYSSLSTMVLIFGIIFEVPVVISLLGFAGLVTSQMVSKNRRIVFLGSFIIGAILSPPDVFSQILVSTPIYVMVELSVIALKIIESNREKNAKIAAEKHNAEEAERQKQEQSALEAHSNSTSAAESSNLLPPGSGENLPPDGGQNS